MLNSAPWTYGIEKGVSSLRQSKIQLEDNTLGFGEGGDQAVGNVCDDFMEDMDFEQVKGHVLWEEYSK